MAAGCGGLLLSTVLLSVAVQPVSSGTRRGDDLTLAGLQAVVDQQTESIQQLQASLQSERDERAALGASLDNVKDEMTELKGRNQDLQTEVASLTSRLETAAQPVGFSVRFLNDGGQYTGVLLGAHQTLVFDSVLTNIGNGYDPNTGIFTAPVSGLYSFFLTQMTADSEPHLWLSVQKDGETLDRIYTEGGQGDTHDQGASQVTVELDKGAKVWVRQEEGKAVRGAWFTVFTGFLVQAAV